MNKPLLILSAIAAITFSSCDDKSTTNPEPLGPVTIKGAIVSNLDEDEDVPKDEKIPANVPVYVMDNNTGAVLATVMTTADGYTATIQISGPRDIFMVVGDFQTQINVPDPDHVGDFHKVNALYNQRESSDVIFSAVKGSNYIQDIEISQPKELNY